MTPNISEYTFEKLLKYDSSDVNELIQKMGLEIKYLELEFQYRNILREKAVSFVPPVLPAGTKSGHFSHPKAKYNKFIQSYDSVTGTITKKISDLKDEKQRVLLNQSLRGIKHDISMKFTPFVFNADLQGVPSWQNSPIILPRATSNLNSHLSQWKNSQVIREIIISKPEPITIRPPVIVSKPIPVTIRPPVIISKPEPVTEITPEILPSIVATSSLLPLGIIALLLYSRTGRK